MNKITHLLKTYIIIFIVLLLYLLFITLFNYKGIINTNILNIVNYIFMILLFFILGFNYSSKIRNKGYLNGFISSIILILLFSLFSLIISKLDISSLVYYLSLILSSITGGIISSLKYSK